MKYSTLSSARSNLGWSVVGIVGLLVVAIVFVVPEKFNQGIDIVNNKTGLGVPHVPEKPFRLGLDLRGGVQLVYQADVKDIDSAAQAEAVEGVRDVIERRVNGMGVGEPVVQTSHLEGTYRINAELPGVTDVAQAIKMIGETPILEFKEQNTEAARKLTADEQKQLDTFNKQAEAKAKELLDKIKKGAKFEDVARTESADETSRNNSGYLGYVPANSPYKELYDWAAKAKAGDLGPIIKTADGYNLAKRGADKAGENEVKASHILICYLGARGCDNATMTKDEARAKAKELYDKATAANFAQLAKDNSVDPGSASRGGDLSWFGKGQMVPEFEQAVMAAKKGDIVGPVETPFGFHVIYKQDERATREYELSRILVRTRSENDILPPPEPWKPTGLSGKQLERAEVVTDQQTGAVQVSLRFNSEGAKLFEQITTRNINQPVAIFLDQEPISIPRVNSAISDGNAVITGQFSIVEARLLAQRLNAGALPVPVELISQQAIGATLGAESLSKSMKAGAMSLVVIMIFMIGVYRLPGLISVVSLCLYTALTLAIFKLMGVTITLAGIAGFIMSLGVAIDANVLIFERLKEELQQGKSLRLAAEEGFLRAWTSIRDGNAATLITSIILMWFGTSFVKGFALTLIIGTLVSLFTAITVTRALVRFIIPWFKNDGGWLFLGSKK